MPAAPAWSRWMCESSRWRTSASSSPRSASACLQRGDAGRRPAVVKARARRRSRAGSSRRRARSGGGGRSARGRPCPDSREGRRGRTRHRLSSDRLSLSRVRATAVRGRGRADQRCLEIGDEVVGRLDPDREADEVRRRGERRVGGRGVRHRSRHLDQALDAAEALGQLPDLSCARRARPPPRRSTRGTRPSRRSRTSGARRPRARGGPAGPGRGRAPTAGGRRGTRRPRGRSRSARACAARASSARAGRATSRTGPGRRRASSGGRRAARRSSGRSSRRSRRSRSEWPPRYFVVEWTTMSAPSSSGRWRYGVAKVLSTATTAPAACAASATARMSTTFSSGFVGVSSQTRRVRSSIASTIAVVRGELELVALRLVDLREEPVGAAVDVVHGDDPLAGRDEVHHRRRRAHAGREREAVLRALQRGEAGLERAARRVGGARVVVALVLADRLLRRRSRSGRSAR